MRRRYLVHTCGSNLWVFLSAKRIETCYTEWSGRERAGRGCIATRGWTNTRTASGKRRKMTDGVRCLHRLVQKDTEWNKMEISSSLFTATFFVSHLKEHETAMKKTNKSSNSGVQHQADIQNEESSSKIISGLCLPWRRSWQYDVTCDPLSLRLRRHQKCVRGLFN